VKRDVRLHGLTSDHHHALVLARRIREAAAGGSLDAALPDDARRRYDEELAPHFAIEEEEELLPALGDGGRQDLVDRTLREHEALRGHLRDAQAGDTVALAQFGTLTRRTFRFEEGDRPGEGTDARHQPSPKWRE